MKLNAIIQVRKLTGDLARSIAELDNDGIDVHFLNNINASGTNLKVLRLYCHKEDLWILIQGSCFRHERTSKHSSDHLHHVRL